MKLKKLSVKVFIAVALLLLVQAFLPTVQAAATTEVNGGYTTEGKKYKLLKGDFKFPAATISKDEHGDGDLKDISATFFYSDGFFAASPDKYNPSLATASLCLAMAGFYSNEGYQGEGHDYSNKSKNIVQYMKDIGVASDDIYRNAYNRIRPQTDSIGVTIGKKATSNDRTLIIISIRGSNYEREWASNVTLGTEKEAVGFSRAAGIVFSSIQNYINTKGLAAQIDNGKVDFWIAGYSRAGATTNLTAKRLVDTYVSKGNKVFAYCLEAPQGGIKTEEQSGSNYACIHSVINKNDFVPYVAPKSMAFQRYGVDHYIPGTSADYKAGNSDNEFYEAGSQSYLLKRSIMETHLKAIDPNISFGDSFATYGLDTNMFAYFNETKFVQTGTYLSMNKFLDSFLDYFTGWTKTDRKKYAEILQPILHDIMMIVYDAHPARIELFNERLQKLLDKDVTKIDLLGILVFAMGKWDKPGYPHKDYYINKVIDKLIQAKCIEALGLKYPVRQKLIRIDLPVLLDLLMTFMSVDYTHNLYETRGLTQTFTFLFNSANIGLNHVPEVTLAWLRADDPLYSNETSSVQAANYFNSAASAPQIDMIAKISSASGSDSSSKVILITEISDTFVEYGTALDKSLLPEKVMAEYNDGNIEELSINWNESFDLYVHSENSDGTLWEKINDDMLAELALEKTDPLMAIFTGKVTGAEMAEGVSPDVSARVFVAGIPRLDPPEASLVDGEYNGPQKVTLTFEDVSSGDIYYSIFKMTEEADGSINGESEEAKKYTGPITIGQSGLTESEDLELIAYVKSNNPDVIADSEILIWSYTISPLVSEDAGSSVIKNNISKTFTLSKDIAVCWRVDSSRITFSLASAAAAEDEIIVSVTPANAEEVPTKRIDVTVMTLAGTTLKGIYKIPVQTSTDGGQTWTDEEPILFNTVEAVEEAQNNNNSDNNNSNGSEASSNPGSSGGCSIGAGVLALLALIFKRK